MKEGRKEIGKMKGLDEGRKKAEGRRAKEGRKEGGQTKEGRK
jgi:hypothetical protein